MKIKTSSRSSGIGFIGLLTLLLIGLKLTNLIDWTWIWVLSPLWLSLSAVLIVIVFLFILFRR